MSKELYVDNYMLQVLMVEIQDRAAQGRACGNLGNVHYLLGDFTKAIHFHEERLKIAREFGDRSAERRAHSNLGNAHIFLGEFEAAAEHYKMTLGLAQELGDRAVEAQVSYTHPQDTTGYLVFYLYCTDLITFIINQSNTLKLETIF